MRFKNRCEAGRQIVQKIEKYWNISNPLVLGLSRNGVSMATEVARKIGAELGVLPVCKLRVSSSPDLKTNELLACGKFYRGNRPPLEISNRRVIIIDDALVTGATMAAAINFLRSLKPAWIAVAVPAASVDTLEWIAKMADETLCLRLSETQLPADYWYTDCDEVNEGELQHLLAASIYKNLSLNDAHHLVGSPGLRLPNLGHR